MIGAINAVNTLGDAASALQNVGASFGTVLRPAAYLNAHIVAPYVAGHTVGKAIGPGEWELRPLAVRGAYAVGSYVGHLAANGLTTGWAGWMRDGGFAVATGMAGFYKAMSDAPGATNKKLTVGVPALVGLTGAAIKYVKER